jgi:hypothetical protein
MHDKRDESERDREGGEGASSEHRPPPRHELKTWPDEFQAVLDGKKRHEVRRADRAYQTGDTVLLREWEPRYRDAPNCYTGRETIFTIGHVTAGPSWGLPEELCVFTLIEQRECAQELHLPSASASMWRIESASASMWRIEGRNGAAGLDVAVEPDGRTFLRPVDAGIAGFVLTPEAVAELAILLAVALPGDDPDDGAAARQTREERADKAAEGREPGRVEGVDR